MYRIQTREPVLNHYKWEEERLASEKYLENIMEYKKPGRLASLRLSACIVFCCFNLFVYVLLLLGRAAGVPGRATSRMMTGIVGGELDPLDPDYQRKSRERLADALADDDDDAMAASAGAGAGAGAGMARSRSGVLKPL